MTTTRRMVAVLAATMASLATAAPDVLDVTGAAIDAAEVQLRPKTAAASRPAQLRSTLLRLPQAERIRLDLRVPEKHQGPGGQWSPVRCWMARLHAFMLDALVSEAKKQGRDVPGLNDALARLHREMGPCFDDNHPSGRAGGEAAMRTLTAWLASADAPTLHKLDQRYADARRAALSETMMCAPGMCVPGELPGAGRALGLCLAIIAAPVVLPAAPEVAGPMLLPTLRRLAEGH